METDDADAFSYRVFWDYDSGDVHAWVSFFFDCFVALRLDFDVFWGWEGLLQRWSIKYERS